MEAAPGRLRKRSEFLAVAAANRRFTTPGLVLQALTRSATSDSAAPDEQGLRVGFTATKKIGNAVIRNRARRRLRAAVHEVMKAAAPKPADIVLVARAGTLDRPFEQLKGDLAAALRRLGVV
jgi:ribonuclease P protein component